MTTAGTQGHPPLPVGIVGCGKIFQRYVDGLRRFPDVEVIWCADIDASLAEARAAELGIAKAGSPADAASDRLGTATLIVNLTPPAVHARVIRDFLEAGKHVYTEKPLATDLDDARELVTLASRRSLQLGGAPDWYLSRTAQTARSVIESGRIGDPLAVSGFITHSRVERWHPDPTNFFLPGAGPVFDLGPYYVSAMVHLLGAIRAVGAMERRSAATRTVTASDRVTDTVEVHVPTHAETILEFRSGVIGHLTMSFDAWERTMPFIEIHGSDGTLSLPMPHERDDILRIKRHDDEEWSDVGLLDGEPYVHGIGVAEMARSVRSGSQVENSGVLAYHILEALCAVDTSSAERRFVALSSGFDM
jgi:predicted dehydrogenase